MEPFFKYVAIGALVLLILILAVIGVLMTKIQSNVPFPPTQNTCPDYWDVSSNPNYCGVPTKGVKNLGYIATKQVSQNGVTQTQVDSSNKINVGMCSGSTFGCVASGDTLLKTATSDGKALNVTDKYQYVLLNNNSDWGKLYPSVSERCSQKRWASLMNVTWDGVSNFTGC